MDFADEIILIDSNSTDRTVELASPYYTKVIKRPFDNFSNQKNAALQEATMDWILFLDADERISPNLKEEILNTISIPKYDAYKLTFTHYYMDRFLKYHTDKVLRLVKNNGVRFEGTVHESLKIKGPTGLLKGLVYHYTYKGFSNYLNKKVYYSTFQAHQFLNKGKEVTWMKLVLKPYFRYFKSAYIKGACLSGIPGLTVAYINGYGVFLRLVKAQVIADNSSGVNFQSLESYDLYLNKQFQNCEVASLKIDTGHKVNYGRLLLLTKWCFFKSYILKLNCLSGKKGFIISYQEASQYFITEVFFWLRKKGLN